MKLTSILVLAPLFSSIAAPSLRGAGGQQAASSVSVTPRTLPSAVVGVPYAVKLQATGGTPPYTWTLTAGMLPPGLSLSPAGIISGTPRVMGSYRFAVQVRDSGTRKGLMALTLSVAPAASAE